jgi:hypothetical protein
MEKEYNLHKSNLSHTKLEVWKESSWTKVDKIYIFILSFLVI